MTLQRYLTRLIWICTLPLLLLSALLAFDRWREQRIKEERGAGQLLQSARQLLDDDLKSRLAGLQTLAASPLVDDPASWPAFRLEAGGYLAAYGSHVALIDAQRQTRLHTNLPLGEEPPPAPKPTGRSAVALALTSGESAVGDLFEGTVAHEPMAGLAAPVLRDGVAKYVVGSVIPLRQIEKLLGDLPIAPGWSVAVLDSHGRLLARRGAVSAPEDADDDLRVADRLELAPWTVEVRVLHELTTHARQRMAGLLAALVLGTLLAAWVGGWRASRRLARSVRSLSDPQSAPRMVAEIIEIRDARRAIDDAQAQRERIEMERRDSEQTYREALERSAAELRESQSELRRLLSAQHRVEDSERRRIARELHDELQQSLVAIKMLVGSIAQESAADPNRLTLLVGRIEELVGTAVSSTRRIVNDLRPLMLEELGLLPALEALCQQFEERTGIEVDCALESPAASWPPVSERVEICLYRVAQESLTNVAKHAGASQVQVRLSAQPDGKLCMRISDNGRGIDRDGRHKPMAFGLKGMTERVRALSGSLRIESGQEGGTLVIVEIGPNQE
jgi:signal transduction histidine kinase